MFSNLNSIKNSRVKGWYWTVEPAKTVINAYYKLAEIGLDVKCPEKLCSGVNSFIRNMYGLGINAKACFECSKCHKKFKVENLYTDVLNGLIDELPLPTDYQQDINEISILTSSEGEAIDYGDIKSSIPLNNDMSSEKGISSEASVPELFSH
ncbi:hypothetical protein AYI69_g9606 [Smittium culicis]|uniref:Uncharacterized protein n=1 Tax=Smittium culicis TaxID=133412 RepID=A0A1R1XBK0_9FUNG|nr:hypothetical protein AYI69_g9606 [Smittium culicis]